MDTGGALNIVRKKIKGNMLVINGNSYLDYNFTNFIYFL